jgi:NitT/TauT family transport system permease protein
MSEDEASRQQRGSSAYKTWLKQERRARLLVHAFRIILLFGFLLLWEVMARTHMVNPLLTSYPSSLLPTFVSLLDSTPYQPSILLHTWSTASATIVGFALATVLGTVIAAGLWWSDRLYRVLDPYLVVANAMPKTAFVPIFYLWLGPVASVYAMSLAISLFITVLMIHSGFHAVDPNKIKLAHTFGATKWQVLVKIVLPGSLPTLIAALKVNAGLSLVGVVVGEFQSGNLGLGYLIQYGSQIFRMNVVMTAITILALLSGLMYLAIARLENAVMRRR